MNSTGGDGVGTSVSHGWRRRLWVARWLPNKTGAQASSLRRAYSSVEFDVLVQSHLWAMILSVSLDV